MEDDYQFDAFDDGSSRLVGDKHVHNFQTFLNEYSEQLREIEEALSEALSDMWDATTDPVALAVEPYEQTNLVELINTENKLLNKIILVFSALCKESKALVEQAEQKFYSPFLLFGQDLPGGEPEEGDVQLQIGKMLPFLVELGAFVNRIYAVVKNMIRQLASLYHSTSKMYKDSFKDVHLNTVFYELSELLTVLITLDEIITQNNAFKNAWGRYKRMTKSVREDPSRYASDEERLMQFDKLLLSLEGQLLDGLIYQNCIEQEFDFPGLVEVRSNDIFEKEFFWNIKGVYTRMTSRSGDLNEAYQSKHFIGLCSLYVFYFMLFKKNTDKKFFKMVWDMHKSIPLIHLAGNIVWFSSDFLRKKVPYMVKNAVGKAADIRKQQAAYVKELDANIASNVARKFVDVTTWQVRMESSLQNRADMRVILNQRISLVIAGVKLAYEVSKMFKEYTYMHSYLRVPLKPSRVPILCQCVELLKAIQITFHRASAWLGEGVAYMVQQVAFYLQRAFFPIKVKLESSSRYNDQRLDVLSAADLCMQMLNGCASDERRIVLRLAMHIVFQTNSIKSGEVEDIKNQVRKLDVMCNVKQLIDTQCDCAFFYWSRVMVPLYFQDILKNPQEAQRMQYMYGAFRDIVPRFYAIQHADPQIFLDAYKKEIDGCLKRDLLKPLSTEIEINLRYHIHEHLEVKSSKGPFEEGVKDLLSLVNLKPLRFFDRMIDIKAHIEHYLDKTFYNLTTVALYDWRTYAEMRNLAKEKFGLRLAEVHLPGQTLEQGVDVLEIMRNIHVFVSTYSYNINQQLFIQRKSDSKFLNTININHIANSLRTHGAGIMNTTVNFTYQFLRKKFTIFTQFLYDDHIKGRLFKDIRFFKDNKEALDSRYPFERAELLIREIRKLGTSADGLSYLDQFRGLITEIGNAMGYIRMVRSGGLLYTANSVCFVPDLQKDVNFQELCAKEGLSKESVDAAKNLDDTLKLMKKNFAEGTDYFKMLVKVFAPEMRNENNLHMRNFYIIVPALCLNYVEYMLILKDKFKTKKGQQTSECRFTDDGFAIGLAYILKMLDQFVEFDSLHWFEAVSGKYGKQYQALQAELSKKDNKLKKDVQQTHMLTMKKLKSYQLEFELLRFSFSASRIFFKDDE